MGPFKIRIHVQGRLMNLDSLIKPPRMVIGPTDHRPRRKRDRIELLCLFHFRNRFVKSSHTH